MKTIISFIGLLLISVLFPIINLIVNIYVFIVAVFIKKKDPAKYLWFHYLEFDRYSASAHAHLWNDILVQKDASYRFEEGNNRNTISYHLKLSRTELRRFGKFIALFLNKVDKGHLDSTQFNNRIKEIRNGVE